MTGFLGATFAILIVVGMPIGFVLGVAALLGMEQMEEGPF